METSAPTLQSVTDDLQALHQIVGAALTQSLFDALQSKSAEKHLTPAGHHVGPGNERIASCSLSTFWVQTPAPYAEDRDEGTPRDLRRPE